MKKLKATLAFITALCFCEGCISMTGQVLPERNLISASAEDVATFGACGENLTWNFDTITGTLTISGTGAMDNWEFGKYSTNAPGWYGFHEDIKEVVIESSVTTIGKYAFYNCSALESVIILDSVTTIKSSAFEHCTSLGSIIIPDSVTTIEDFSFSFCSSLEFVTIPASVTTIEMGSVFYHCTALNAINISENNPIFSTQDNVLYDKEKTTLIYAPKGITECIIPESVTTISHDAFSSCSFLKSIIIPDNVTVIESSAFSGCSALEFIIIPNGVTKINSFTFNDCSALKSIIIPDGITVIDGGAFQGCSALESIVIPNSVTVINGAFNGCSSLKSVNIPDGITEIAGFAFSGCSSLESIIIPDGVTKIGDLAFAGCSALESIIIPDNVTIIGETAFEGCSALESIIIPQNVVTIGSGAFWNCTALKAITIENPRCGIYASYSVISSPTIIYGYANSTAQAYAEKYKREFVALDENPVNSEILWGDANHDGTVDISDVVLMNRVYVGVDQVSAEGMKNADVDQSGKIELSDSMNVLRLLVHLLETSDFPIQAES